MMILAKPAKIKEKDAFILLPNTVPSFLKKNVAFNSDGSKAKIIALEGEEVIPVVKSENWKEMTVVAYEKDDRCVNGYNLWWKKNAATTLDYRDGKFYTLPDIVFCDGELMRNNPPAFLKGADIKQIDENHWGIKPDWSDTYLSGAIGEAVWVRYGTHKDGTPDANILDLYTASAREYEVYEAQDKNARHTPLVEFLGVGVSMTYAEFEKINSDILEDVKQHGAKAAVYRIIENSYKRRNNGDTVQIEPKYLKNVKSGSNGLLAKLIISILNSRNNNKKVCISNPSEIMNWRGWKR